MMDRLEQLQSPDAEAAVSAYMAELDRVLDARRKPVRDDVRTGVEAHLLEALDHDPASSLDRVSAALSALGPPDSFAHDWANAVEARYPQGRVELGAAALRERLVLVGRLAAVCLGVVVGFAGLLSVLGRLTEPDTFGVFLLADGEILIGTWQTHQAAVEQDILGWFTAPAFALLAALGFVGAWVMRPLGTKR